MKEIITIILGVILASNIYAEGTTYGELDDNVKLQQDSTSVSFPKKEKLKFTQIDTNYIEPQHYNFTVQFSANTSYDYFYGKTKNDLTLLNSASLAPIPTIKVGPDIGWRWLVYGYTFVLNHNAFSKDTWKQKSDFNLVSTIHS